MKEPGCRVCRILHDWCPHHAMGSAKHVLNIGVYFSVHADAYSGTQTVALVSGTAHLSEPFVTCVGHQLQNHRSSTQPGVLEGESNDLHVVCNHPPPACTGQYLQAACDKWQESSSKGQASMLCVNRVGANRQVWHIVAACSAGQCPALCWAHVTSPTRCQHRQTVSGHFQCYQAGTLVSTAELVQDQAMASGCCQARLRRLHREAIPGPI